MNLPFELFIAQRYLWGKKKVSFISTILIISIAGVFLGTMVLIVTLSIMNGFEREVKKNIVGSISHIKIQRYHHEAITNPDSLAELIRKNPEVVGVSPLIEDKIGLASKEVRDGILIKGVDPETEGQVTDLDKNIKFGTLNLGPAPSVKGRDNPGIILGSYVADRLRVMVGDEVILMSLRGEEDALAGVMPKMKRATVTGLYESGMYEYDANLAFVSLSTAQNLLDMKGVMSLEVRIKNADDASRVGSVLQEYLGYPYYSTDWMKQYATLIKWMNSEKFIAFIVVSMIILVAIFNIISSLLMVIMEKTGEIGILLSMGATPKNIRSIFLFNGLFVGVIGTLGGTLAGLAICFVQIHFQLIKLPGDVYFISTLPMLLNYWDVLAVVVTANVLALLFSFYPAYKASRLKPVEALVYK
jgi:lipoprotein-releasing system permease protein